jgi:hypothetical protein
MQVPENFRTRIAGNIYENTPDLVVCNDTTILRVERADSGSLKVRLAVFDSNGRRKATIEDDKVTQGRQQDYSVAMTDSNFSVHENATGRTVCNLQRCAPARRMDIDAFVMTHSPDGFLIHASPLQTNLGTKARGEVYRDLDHALLL